MAKKKVESAVDEPAVGAPEAAPEAEAEVKPEPEAPAKGDIVVKYRDHKGEETSRTFSKEVHGKDFAKLAAEFKATNAARLIE
jgi:hypothetical protein